MAIVGESGTMPRVVGRGEMRAEVSQRLLHQFFTDQEVQRNMRARDHSTIRFSNRKHAINGLQAFLLHGAMRGRSMSERPTDIAQSRNVRVKEAQLLLMKQSTPTKQQSVCSIVTNPR